MNSTSQRISDDEAESVVQFDQIDYDNAALMSKIHYNNNQAGESLHDLQSIFFAMLVALLVYIVIYWYSHRL
jgi:hypothetical protein